MKDKNFILIREGHTKQEIQVFLKCSPIEFAHLMFSFFASKEGEPYYKELLEMLHKAIERNDL